MRMDSSRTFLERAPPSASSLQNSSSLSLSSTTRSSQSSPGHLQRFKIHSFAEVDKLIWGGELCHEPGAHSVKGKRGLSTGGNRRWGALGCGRRRWGSTCSLPGEVTAELESQRFQKDEPGDGKGGGEVRRVLAEK